MKKINTKKGFTLIEMLVVIAIIAVLVAIIIPTVSNAKEKANAATDAANLRAVLGYANIILMDSGATSDSSAWQTSELTIGACKTFPGAHIELLYEIPGFIRVYYVDDGNYYGLEYFSAIAEEGEEDASLITTKAALQAEYPTANFKDLSDLENEG